jgi:ACS family hexuronate transporter-like MFS transporter
MMRRGWSLQKSRKVSLGIGAAFLPVAIMAPLAPNAALAIAATCSAVLGHAIWVANLLTLPADIFRSNEVGTATGFSGMGGAIGGALANFFTGAIVTNFSFLPLFICAGLMHPLSAVLVWWLLPARVFEAPPAYRRSA